MTFLFLLHGYLGVAPRFLFQLPPRGQSLVVMSPCKAVYPEDSFFSAHSDPAPKQEQQTDQETLPAHFLSPLSAHLIVRPALEGNA